MTVALKSRKRREGRKEEKEGRKEGRKKKKGKREKEKERKGSKEGRKKGRREKKINRPLGCQLTTFALLHLKGPVIHFDKNKCTLQEWVCLSCLQDLSQITIQEFSEFFTQQDGISFKMSNQGIYFIAKEE